MSNGINLTLDAYKDKDLPLTITINGHTYYSQYALATAQTTYFEMGKAIGIEEGKNEALAEIEKKPNPVEFPTYQHGWSEGYDDGFEEGKSAGYDEGYEIGKKAYGYSSDDIKQLHTDMNHLHHLWYDKGYNAGKSEGYKEGYTDCREVAKMLNKYGIDEDGVAE